MALIMAEEEMSELQRQVDEGELRSRDIEDINRNIEKVERTYEMLSRKAFSHEAGKRFERPMLSRDQMRALCQTMAKKVKVLYEDEFSAVEADDTLVRLLPDYNLNRVPGANHRTEHLSPRLRR